MFILWSFVYSFLGTSFWCERRGRVAVVPMPREVGGWTKEQGRSDCLRFLFFPLLLLRFSCASRWVCRFPSFFFFWFTNRLDKSLRTFILFPLPVSLSLFSSFVLTLYSSRGCFFFSTQVRCRFAEAELQYPPLEGFLPVASISGADDARCFGADGDSSSSSSGGGGVQCLILEPTRDLAMQTYRCLENFGEPSLSPLENVRRGGLLSSLIGGPSTIQVEKAREEKKRKEGTWWVSIGTCCGLSPMKSMVVVWIEAAPFSQMSFQDDEAKEGSLSRTRSLVFSADAVDRLHSLALSWFR